MGSSVPAPKTLRLPYREPYDFAALLEFFARRALPGIEHVDAHAYTRRFASGVRCGTLQVTRAPNTPALVLRVAGADAAQLPALHTRVRRMFDLDADVAAINAHLRADKVLKPLLRRHPGQRLPGGWDGFEIAVRAVLGQQISVAAARTLATRIVARFGTRPRGGDDARLFPAPQILAQADLTTVGLPRARALSLNAIARAVSDNTVAFDPEQALDDFVASWTELPGIGDWTAHYIAMRALSHADAFPAADLVLRKAVSNSGTLVSTKTLTAIAENWRPWRAYAVLHLWRSAA